MIVYDYNQGVVKDKHLSHIGEQMKKDAEHYEIEKILNVAKELTAEQIKNIQSAVRSEREGAEIALGTLTSLETILKHCHCKAIIEGR